MDDKDIHFEHLKSKSAKDFHVLAAQGYPASIDKFQSPSLESLPTEELIGILNARKIELDILIKDLEKSTPKVWANSAIFVLVIALLFCAVAAIVIPFLATAVPKWISTLGSCLSVAACAASYTTFKIMGALGSEKQAYNSIMARAHFLRVLGQDVLKENANLFSNKTVHIADE